jgi:RNA polymerase sigma-70 factor (ECF subfamily)
MSNSLRADFEKIHLQYQPMVLQMCLGFMKGDRDQARDLSQEVFINTWTALPNYRGEASYKTWIYRITVNTCLMYIRKQKDKVRLPLEEVSGHEDDAGAGKREQSDELYVAIGRLEHVDRLIMMMVLDELEYDEIARIVGVTENNLRVKIHRIKLKLKTLLENGKGSE